MDPNPKSFPILSYVMSRLHPNPILFRSLEPDIEQPPVSDPPPSSDEVELVERMPHLDHPDLLASMATAVSEVAQTRAVLSTLGDRPDHEAVDAARSEIAEIESALARRLEEIVRARRPEDVDRVQWRAEQAELEGQCRAEAEREMNACKAVIQLDEMHEAYGRLLRVAEDRLVKMYGSVEESSDGAERGEEGDGERVNEEVVGILQEASGKFLQRVDLSDRQLKSIPEAFGRMRGLISLNLSNNLLEAIPDSIGGLEHLEELRVSSNLLISLPDSIGLLLNLKILDVSGNQLKALPDSIARCRSLVELDASYNSLTYLPTNIGYELVNLQELQIHLNKIRSLPTSVCQMRSLRLLDAHFNELRGLPYAIGNLTNLEVLNLSSNFSDLKVLPDSIGDLANLRELDLSNNQIHALPDSFGRLERLAKLNLDQNPMVVPPAEVVNEGVEAVREFMANIMLSRVLEEQKIMEENPAPAAGWLTRSTSWLNSFVPGSVAGYIGVGQKSPRDPILDQEM